MGFDQGFDHFVSRSPSREADTTHAETVLALRDAMRGGRPDFVYLHYMDVHAPNPGRPPFFDASLEGRAREVSAYDSGLRYLDGHLERVFSALGWAASAVTIVSSDHGEELYEHGLAGHARTLFAEVLNVPLIVHAPARFAPTRVAERVSHVDVLPTLRALVSLPPAPADAGRRDETAEAKQKAEATKLYEQISPKNGYNLSVSYGALGPQLLERGVISYDALAELYKNSGTSLTARRNRGAQEWKRSANRDQCPKRSFCAELLLGGRLDKQEPGVD